MASLSETIKKVREKIAQHQGEELNEQDTKTALVNPVLCALGWHVGNLNEVREQYKDADYALFVEGGGKPSMLVEAKALREDLDERKYGKQVMAYTGTLGAGWAVLTNGDEWRIYNATGGHLDIEERLFRKVRLSDPNSPAEETLLLLSKERFNDLENQWNLYFADRQVRGALKHLFTTPDSRLVRLVRKHVKVVTSKRIGEILDRMRDQFERFIDGYQSGSPTKPVPPSTIVPDKKGDEGSDTDRHVLRHKFWTALLKRAKAKTDLHGDILASKRHWIGTGAGKGGLAYNYVITQHGSKVELYISRGKGHQEENKTIFDNLKGHQQEIEQVFGEPLSWEPLEGKQAKRIGKYLDGGYRDDPAKWPEIQDAMIDAMVRLESALRPFVVREAARPEQGKGSTQGEPPSGPKGPKMSLRDIIAAGLLKPPLKLTAHYRETDLEAELLPNSMVCFRNKTYKTCSAAAAVAKGTITGRPMQTAGWLFWQYRDQKGNLVPLDAARQEYLKRKGK